MNYVFPTAATVAVFIDGIHIDLLHRLDYKESLPKLPRYGYNDTLFSNIMPGRKIVQGFLAISFVEPGYLTRVLERNMSNSKDHSIENLTQDRIDQLPPNTSPEEKQHRAEYIANLIFPTSELGKNKFSSVQERHLKNVSTERDQFIDRLINKFANGSIRSGPDRPNLTNPLGKGPVNMDVYYMDPEKVTWYQRFVGLEFDETSQTISAAGAEGSSEPLYEIYSFICKDREIHVI